MREYNIILYTICSANHNVHRFPQKNTSLSFSLRQPSQNLHLQNLQNKPYTAYITT